MIEEKLKVEGMNCQHCVKAIEVELEELNLESVKVEVGLVVAKFDESKSSEKDIIAAIMKLDLK